jgi:NAD(P)-dependent dehydrogenase (short-subunit alcohol dehydrogenase family)
MRWAFITGTSTGIGRAIVLQLLNSGVSVFAGVRREKDVEALTAAASQQPPQGAARLVPLLVDVAKPEQITAAIAQAAQVSGADGLWAVVNNAGIVVPGPLEFVTLDEWRRQFDVNFFGVVEVTRQALPLLRRGVAAHGAGVPRLMIVSSIGGRIAQPILSPYTSSKWAATSLGDSLRLELRRQGIGVTVLEPGAVATPIWEKGDSSAGAFSSDHPANEVYGPEIAALATLARKTAAMAAPAEKIAQIAVDALLRRRAPARVLAGTDARIGAFLRGWLPLSWFDAILLRQFGFDRLPPASLNSRIALAASPGSPA